MRVSEHTVLERIRGFVVFGTLLGGLLSPGVAAAFEEDPHPRIVVNFYFGGTFGTGTEWKNDEAPWETPALWESMYHYAKHRTDIHTEDETLEGNRYGLLTFHVYIPGVAAWRAAAWGDKPHCFGNPRGWDDVHSWTWSGGAGYYWKNILTNLEKRLGTDYGKVIVNIAGQSRGGLSAIRFASEILAKDTEDPHDSTTYERIAWINVVSTDPVLDENASCTTGYDYTRWHHYVLGPKVRNYIGIYAEDERASDFWPVLPYIESSPTREIILTVPGSHQTLVGNAGKDGHKPKKWLNGFPNRCKVWDLPETYRPLSESSYSIQPLPDPTWEKLHNAVAYLVLDLYDTAEFGYTEFKYSGSPNYLADATAQINSDAKFLQAIGEARSGPGDLSKSVSFLPKGIYFRGKLMAWVGGACEQPLSWQSTKDKLFRNARCGIKAKGVDPDGDPNDGDLDVDENWELVGVEKASALTQTAQIIIPKDTAQQMLDAIQPIRDSNAGPSYTIEVNWENSGVVEPFRDQVVKFGESVSFTFRGAGGSPPTYVKDVEVNGVSKGRLASYTFENVTRSQDIKVIFEPYPPISIKVEAGPGGGISPSPAVAVIAGRSQQFSVWGDSGNRVNMIDDNGTLVGPFHTTSTRYTIPDVGTENRTFKATFFNTYGFYVGVSPAAGGVVVDTQGAGRPLATRVNCGSGNFDCYEPVYSGEFIDLVPSASTGFKFAAWTGCDEGPEANPCRVYMNAVPEEPSGNSKVLVAHFISDPGGDDDDGDGVPTEVENKVLDSRDGNFDGTPDCYQASVASFPTRTGTYCTIDVSDQGYGNSATLKDVKFEEESDVADDPPFVYPFGVFSFTAEDWYGPVQVKVLAHGLESGSGFAYRKYSTTAFTWETISSSIYSITGPASEVATVFDFEYFITEVGTGDSVVGDQLFAKGGPALVDSDGDGIADDVELNLHGSNPFDADSDGDGLSDSEELGLGTDPANEDSNGDGVSDKDQVDAGKDPLNPDSDGDGIPNQWEVQFGLDPFVDDSLLDPDGDGMTNLEEFNNDQNPNADYRDGDGDGMPTLWEDEYGLDPESDDANGDADNDGLTNLQEYKIGSDPSDPQSVPVELMKFRVE